MIAIARTEAEKVPCKWCGTPTAMLGTEMCDGCWELDRRIGVNPELARRILAAAQPSIEFLDWKDVAAEMPDDDITVLLDFDNADPWPGWHEDGQWFDVSGAEVEHVTRWADMPEGRVQ